MGYELARAILQHSQSFLLRMSSKVRLYALDKTPIETGIHGGLSGRPEARTVFPVGR